MAVEFETLEEKEVELPKGRLLVALKKALSEKGEIEFVSISKADDNGKFRQTLTIPRNAKVVEELAAALRTVVSDDTQDAFTDPTTEEVDEETARALQTVV